MYVCILLNRGAMDNKKFLCDICGKKFTAARSHNLHKQTHFGSYKCNICGRQYTRKFNLKKHMRTPHTQRGGQNTSLRNVADRETQTAMNNKVQIKTFEAHNQDRYDLLTFLANIKQKVKGVIRLRARHSAVKWYLVARVQLYREDGNGNVHTVQPFLGVLHINC